MKSFSLESRDLAGISAYFFRLPPLITPTAWAEDANKIKPRPRAGMRNFITGLQKAFLNAASYT
jgi:hypothetical protein